MANEMSVPTKQEVSDERTRAGRAYSPRVDISETEEALWLWADVPGVDEDSIDVRLEDDVLSIEGRVSIDEYANLDPVYTEYNVGNFVRTFRLSDKIDRDGIRAKVTQGTLEVQLPKVQAMQPRRIAVSAG